VTAVNVLDADRRAPVVDRFNDTAYGSEVCACVDVFYSAVQCG
jgi:hypothetical protein